MVRVVQIVCIAITALILWGLKSFLQTLTDWGGPGFNKGFVLGMAFVMIMYFIAIWIDPSSRPRGSGPKQD
ncbi:hypothetical protein [Sinorhizobium meliloti]|uniref:hypothetical protein n=1 Tax=Rhizobium meliloti TaxID=382 RepID=UPI000FDC371A|nr:hypothetical protein [Sinorhizobium meliloti]RVG89285.1 hypothetical protein CN219_02260 [Sinorhizobium meliloti]RVI33966.1 hypothetical protein CN197_16985 [Sinorhizobium meliloti]RVI45074.1 hypothetical protein CN196_14010 [Sinorhizobium meliloti]RVJ30157.1 hypothetical protein CN177_03655 [Sinorhizobium meliloti]RVK03062.1 hypothetical protein CN170_05330 [Sinorhizobium meliloti]